MKTPKLELVESTQRGDRVVTLFEEKQSGLSYVVEYKSHDGEIVFMIDFGTRVAAQQTYNELKNYVLYPNANGN